MTSGAVTQVVCERACQNVRLSEQQETHVLNVGIVGSGNMERTTSSFRLALLVFGSLPHPHGHVFSDLWFAVPGHDGTFTGIDLRPSESSGLDGRPSDLTSSRASSSRVGARLWCMLWAGKRQMNVWNTSKIRPTSNKGGEGHKRQEVSASHGWVVR